jgi:Methyltransferase domain
LDIHKLYALFQPYFRRRRMQRFASFFVPGPETTIIDVGGYPWNWAGGSVRGSFTIVNVHKPNLSDVELDEWNFTLADGRHLPFDDLSFDIAFSNSVIEHLSTYQSQAAFASEVRRVGKRVWVQTPAKTFPIEPHLLTPFVHYLPRRLQQKLLRFTVWGIVAKPTPQQREEFLHEVRLLTHREMKRLFPDCRILRERFLLVTKSYIAVR